MKIKSSFLKITKCYLYLRVFKFDTFFRLKKIRFKNPRNGFELASFDKYKCIFVHIPKCAGVSVKKSLFNSKAGGHLSTCNYIGLFGLRTYEQYFSFTIVRNPWDRLYSAYNFLSQGGITVHDKRNFEKYLSKYKSFDDFVRNWVTEKNIRKILHFKPQTDFITLGGDEILVDYVGRLENIDADFKIICDKLGIDAELKKLNTSTDKNRNYRQYYSDETASIVERVYRKDIQLLGYSFDN